MKIVKNSMWVFALAIAATLAGCSADSEPTGGEPNPFDPSEPTPLEISSTLEAGMEAAVSRATPAPVTLTAGNIGIFLEGTGYTTRNNINYKGTSGVWSANTSTETLLLTGLDASVCAYYPHNAANSNKASIAMTTQEYAASKLFYYAPNQTVNGTRAGRTVRFAMTHAYARVRLHITRKDYPTACVISTITFSNPALPKIGTLNIATAAYTITATGDIAFPTDLPKTLDASETNYIRDLLVVPQTADMTSPVTVKMTVDGKPMTASIPTTVLKKFEAGKQYEISIVIQGTGIVPTVTTSVWEVTTVNNGNGIETMPDPDVP